MLTLPFVCPVAGISNYQRAAARVSPGDVVLVVREPDNPYDRHAVAVRLVDGDLVGYVPKALAARLAASGPDRLAGQIVEVLDSNETIGLRVRVGVADSEEPADRSTDEDDVSGDVQTVAGVVTTRGTGRVLGTFVRRDEGKRQVVVLVRGVEIGYPNALVEVSGTQARGAEGS